jgi:hypothetical protein
MSASERLSRVRLKIERAKHHIDNLEGFLPTLRGMDFHEIRPEVDPETGDKLHRAALTRSIPEQVSLIAGDAVHNLRSALDHLVWQLVEAAGNKPNRCQFPIYESAPKRESDLLAQVKGVAPDAVSLILALQPYQSGNDALWAVHEIDRMDKHRLLLVVEQAMSGIFGGRVIPSWIQDATRWSPRKRFPLLKDRAIVHRVPFGSPDYDMDFKLTTQVAFGEPEVVEGEAVLPLLTQLRELVERVVSSFDPFL